MRRRLACALALVIWTAVAAPAARDYSRVAEVRPDDEIGIAGDVVVIGATPDGGSSVLAAYARDGTARPIELPDWAQFVEELTTTGPVAGPLDRLPRAVIDVQRGAPSSRSASSTIRPSGPRT